MENFKPSDMVFDVKVTVTTFHKDHEKNAVTKSVYYGGEYHPLTTPPIEISQLVESVANRAMAEFFGIGEMESEEG